MMTGRDKELVLVVLVHGTWGRGLFPDEFNQRPRNDEFWFQPDALFHKTLGDALNHEFPTARFIFEAFNWSGANSIKERSSAAIHLADLLKARIAQKIFDAVLIIAHSHGGNIIKPAALTISSPTKLFIATLATPFLEVSASKEIEYDYGANIAVSGCLAFFLYYVLATSLPADWQRELGIQILWIVSYEWSVVLLPFLLLGFGLLIGIAAKLLGYNSTLKAGQLQSLTHGDLDWKSLAHAKIHIIRSIDDEASLVLAAGAIGNRLSIFSAKATQFILNKSPLILLIAVPAIWIYPFVAEISQNLRVWALGLCAVYIVSIVAAGLFKSTHGRELWFGALNSVINAQSAPDLGKTTVVTTLSPYASPVAGLRHAIYNHEDCVPTIVDWLKREKLSG